MLTDELLPLNAGDQYSELPPAASTHTRVPEQAVERARLSQTVKNAWEPDKLSFSAILPLWQQDKVRIARLTRAEIRARRHQAVCNRASGVVICNRGRDDYTKLQAYRSITLLRCMERVVEKVAPELRSEAAESRGLLSDRQLGSRNGQSAINAAAIIVDSAHAACTYHHISGVLLMDIKAAFTSVAKERQVNLMKVRKIDGDLIQWMESFLLEGIMEMTIEGNAVERHPVEAGVPHRSPMSPILFAIYTSGLIKWVKEYGSEAEGLTCVDNLGWVATRSDVNHVI